MRLLLDQHLPIGLPTVLHGNAVALSPVVAENGPERGVDARRFATSALGRICHELQGIFWRRWASQQVR
jgi:hypothetical protein